MYIINEFRSRGPSEFFSQIRHRKALNEIAWEDTFNTRTRHGNVYRGVRDKQTIVVYRQCVLQTVTYLCVLFHQYFEGSISLKSQILIPSKKPDFRYGKKLVLRESDENRVQVQLNTKKLGAWPNVRTESKQPGSKKRNHKKSEFNTFLKLTNPAREQFLLRLTLFTLFTANG